MLRLTADNRWHGSCIIQQNISDGPIANNGYPFSYTEYSKEFQR